MPDTRSISQIIHDWLHSPLGNRSLNDAAAELVEQLEARMRVNGLFVQPCACAAALRGLAKRDGGGAMLFTREAALDLAASLLERRRS